MTAAMTSTTIVEPQTLMFSDDGLIPNNPRLPLLLYRGAIDVDGARDPAAVIEKIFGKNAWGDMWRYGIYPYVHYHSMIHEALGVARGRANVQFGGPRGREVEIAPGDVAVLPAGTGHRCLWSSAEFQVVGAYPKTGTYNLFRASEAEHARALQTIPQVPLPDTDPSYGRTGPLLRLWRE
jgi:uncharacterized protein YjlB